VNLEFKYPHKAISTLRNLSLAIGVDEPKLRNLIDTSDSHYKIATKQLKKDGSFRVTYNASPALKSILKNLRERVLSNVVVADYALAERKGVSYLDNARYHIGAKVLMSEDIKNFFPTVRIKHIDSIFKYLFKFPHEIAKDLANLCTYKGYLVQGSPVSGLLANLIFFDKEPALAAFLESSGCKYSRYCDDIYVSSKDDRVLSSAGIIRSKIYGMLRNKDLEPHLNPKNSSADLEKSEKELKKEFDSRKSTIKSTSARQTVHGVTINSGRLTPSAKRVSALRLELYILKNGLGKLSVEELISYYRSIYGKIQTLKVQGYLDSASFVAQLDQILTLYDKKLCKQYIRGFRKVKTKRKYIELASKSSVLKKVDKSIAGVVNAEKKAVKNKHPSILM
jgi:hypothetical protein